MNKSDAESSSLIVHRSSLVDPFTPALNNLGRHKLRSKASDESGEMNDEQK